MKYYFKKFAQQNLAGKPDEYIWLLYFIYCSLYDVENQNGSLWESLKRRISTFELGSKTIAKINNCSAFLLRNLGTFSGPGLTGIGIPKLSSIQVKNFRGFGSEFNGDDKGVRIEFHNFNTIFYGPNGSGKSSLCDALEYKLTGEVREAVKRNRRINEYIKRIGVSSNPSVTISFQDDSIDSNKLNEEQKKLFSQAFIEKNRIQEFSLFGSKDTGIKKEHILSVLIGMEDLTKLVNELVQFNAFRANLLSFKRTTIDSQINSLNSSNSSNLAIKGSYENVIKAEQEKADKLLGKTSVTIADIDDQIAAITTQISDKNDNILTLSKSALTLHKKEDIESIINDVRSHISSFDANQSVLSAAKDQLKFRNFYVAIESLKTIVTENCPACDTPIVDVVTNPYDKANAELEKLAGLTEVEELAEKSLKSIDKFMGQFHALHSSLSLNLSNNAELKKLVPENSIYMDSAVLYSMNDQHQLVESLNRYADQLILLDNYFNLLAQLIENQNEREATIKQASESISDLNNKKGELSSIKGNWEAGIVNLGNINATLGNYSTDFSKLSAEKVEEDQYNNFIDGLIGVYQQFYSDLQNYKNLEFQSRFGKIESEIAGFYRQINKHDNEHEAIELFRINNNTDDYGIEYKNKGSSIYNDASIKFSEGHLRSLGLSILLANAKINSLPFVIFDDVVNAIDSDHRANIIEMMVNDPYLCETQQIISTHDRLYWERFSIENQNLKQIGYVLKCTSAGVIHYHYKLSFREKIHSALEHYDIRQALLYCRIWFETIAKQYCMERNIQLKGTLKANGFHVSIEPTLGDIYRELENAMPGNIHLAVLKKDEINYKGINQEHHSFDEFNFNFIHSRTSKEVEMIFNAVDGLDSDISFIKSNQSMLDNLVNSFNSNEKNIDKINGAMPKLYTDSLYQKREDILNIMKTFPDRMQNLKIESALISNAENRIKTIFIRIVLSFILNFVNKKAT